MAEKQRPTFVVQVVVPERDPNTDKPVMTGPEGQQTVVALRSLGSFTFRFPSFWEKRTIEMAIDRAITDAGGPMWMRSVTSYVILLASYYGQLIQEAPDGFVLDDLIDNDDIRALWEAIEEGLKTGPKK